MVETADQTGRTELAALTATERDAIIERDRKTTGRIAGAALIVMVGTIFSRLVAIPRESLIAGMFGDGVVTGSFTIAENVLTIFLDLMLSGIASAVLVPVLSDFVGENQRDQLGLVVGKLLTLVVVGGGALLLLLELGARGVAWAMTGVGGNAAAYDRNLIVSLIRMILPALLLLGVASVLQSTLYALQRFTMPALSLAARNASVVLAVLVLGPALGIHSLVVGILVGALLLVALQIPGFRGTGLRIRPSFAWRDPALRRIGALYLPVFLGLLLNTWALIIDRNLAETTGEHGIAAMRFATQVQQLTIGMVVTAISIATLPRLSRAAAELDDVGFGRTLALGMRLVTTLVLPATFGLIALSWPLVNLLFNRGKATPEGVHQIRIALIGYAIGLPFLAWDQLLLFAFYARKNTRTPVVVGALSVGVLLAVSFALIIPLGILGLVLANSAQFAFHALVMYLLARRRIAAFQTEGLWNTTVRAGIAAAIMAGAVLIAVVLVRSIVGEVRFVARSIIVIAGLGTGAVVFIGAAWLLRIDEVRYFGALLRARIHRGGN
ncbi:MAG: murein biosynthesis integral membrane protein MurJ [Thermomicrobiales bacterium]